MPKISVIIPVYGVQNYIERCARSLFGQTLDDIEYIFVDDRSPDDSIKILKEVISDYPSRINQVKIISHDINLGLPYARQTGVQIASGEYIVHCDSDDWLDYSLYEKMYIQATENNLDLVICNINRTDGSNNELILGGGTRDVTDCIKQMLYQKMKWSLCNKMFRKELYSDITYPRDAMGEDMCLTMQLMQKVKSLDYVNECYFYFINPHSIVNSYAEEKIIDKFEQITRNIDIVTNYYNKSSSFQYEKPLNYLRFFKHDILVPLIGNDKYLKIWKNSIKPYLIPVLLDNTVRLKERIKALLIIINLYPISYRVFSTFKSIVK